MLSWRALIQWWLVAISKLEAYHGSRGKGFVYDFASDKWVRSEASKENNVAVQINTDDLVSGDDVNGLDKLVVKSTSELRGIGGDIVDDAMGVEVEVVSEIMRDVLGDGTNEDEDERINDSVGMYDATQSDNGDGGIVNDMDLGDDGAARRFFPNIRLRAIDSDEDSVEDIVEDMEMEAEVVEEEDFEEDFEENFEAVDIEAVADEDIAIQQPQNGEEPYDNSISGSVNGAQASKNGRDFASVSKSPIIPLQPSLLGVEEIGQGPRGSHFDFVTASSVMCDLSHFGMIHNPGE